MLFSLFLHAAWVIFLLERGSVTPVIKCYEFTTLLTWFVHSS